MARTASPIFCLPREQDLVEQVFAEYLFCRCELEQAAKHQGTHDIELQDLSLRCKAEHDVQAAALALEMRCFAVRQSIVSPLGHSAWNV